MKMICVFPIIKAAIDDGNITINDIAGILEKSEGYVTDRLSGKRNFDINEAMTINVNLFPKTPFKELFDKI